MVLIIINLGFTFLYPGISIGGHIGGLIGGILVMLGYMQFRRSVPLAIACALAVSVGAIVFAYAAV